MADTAVLEREGDLDDIQVVEPDVPATLDPSAYTHVVLRRIQGDREFVTGEAVDASGWRNADLLVGTRYLRVRTHEDPQPIEAEGRLFIDDESFVAWLDQATSAEED